MRSDSDYETLRSFVMEGGEVHYEVERGLSVFIMCGVAAWMSPCRNERKAEQVLWAKPHPRHYAGNLAVLLAGIVES